MGAISSGLTFKNIQDRVLEYGYGEVDRDRVKNWINRAYRDVNFYRRWDWLEEEKSIATVADTATTSIGTDVYEIGRVRPADTDAGVVDPYFIPFHNENRNGPFHTFTNATGRPTHWSLYENNIVWYPTPDAVYNFTLYYWITPSDLSADGDYAYVPPEFRHILVDGALIQAARRDQNQQLYETASIAFQTTLDTMAARNHMQTKTTTHVTTTDAYYGKGRR